MGETVAIIPVAASAAVALVSAGSAVWSNVLQRRWQSNEERVIELRGVLEDAGSRVARLLFGITAHARGDPVPPLS
jgi:hypothetical protein